MPRLCAIKTCDSVYRAGVRVHSFPKEEHLAKIWKQCADLGNDKRNLQNYGICISHFAARVYIDSDPATPNSRQTLSQFAYPTEGLPITLTENETLNLGRLLLDQLRDQEIKLSHKSNELTNAINKIERLKTCEKELEALKVKYSKAIKNMDAKLEQHIIELQKVEKNTERKVNDKLVQKLSKVFTDTQIKMLLTPGRRVWNQTDMAMAMSLYSVSSRAYNYLRENGFPLPCKSTLFLWLSRIQLTPGIIQPALEVIKANFENATPMERAAGICFDEVGLDDSIGFDEREQLIIGPCKKLLAVFVRGLCYSPKQLVYYGFDVKLTPELFMDLITKLHDVGLNIKSLTCDLGGGNLGLLKKLGICVKAKKFSFTNPVTGDPIWCFADFCHLLKRMRDNFLDYYFVLDDGTKDGIVIDKGIIRLILSLDIAELQIAWKVTEKHLNLAGRERMNVRTAFELFSGTVAKAIEFVSPKDKSVADFFMLMNHYSDLLNVRTNEKNANPYKCAYGMELDAQSELLDKVTDTISKMRVGDMPQKRKKKALFPFQKGIILTNNSLKGLLADMKKAPVNAEFIMTSHLNQDYVESAFSCFRGFGGFNLNPNPAEAITRMKTLVLTWNLLKPKNSNVQKDFCPQQLSSQNLGMMLAHKPQISVYMNPHDMERLGEIDPYDLTSLSNITYLTRRGKCERGGFEYVSGYIAKKLLKTNPEFGKSPTTSAKQTGWLSMLSERGLTAPSDIWLSTFLKFDEFFTAFHCMGYISGAGTSLNRSPQVITTLVKYLTEIFPDIPERAIKYFVRVRTMIRVKYANKKLEDNKRRNRALKRQAWLQDKKAPAADEHGDQDVEPEDEYRFLLESEEDFTTDPTAGIETDLLDDHETV